METTKTTWLQNHHHVTGFRDIKSSTESNNIKRKTLTRKFKNK